jgi:hypothetical protein
MLARPLVLHDRLGHSAHRRDYRDVVQAASIGLHSGAGGFRGATFFFTLYALFALAVGTGIVLLNRSTVRRSLQSVRDDLAQLIESLESAEDK